MTKRSPALMGLVWLLASCGGGEAGTPTTPTDPGADSDPDLQVLDAPSTRILIADEVFARGDTGVVQVSVPDTDGRPFRGEVRVTLRTEGESVVEFGEPTRRVTGGFVFPFTATRVGASSKVVATVNGTSVEAEDRLHVIGFRSLVARGRVLANEFTCGVLTNSGVACWGSQDHSGVLSHPESSVGSFDPDTVRVGRRIERLWASDWTVCSIAAAASPNGFCWGRGALGDFLERVDGGVASPGVIPFRLPGRDTPDLKWLTPECAVERDGKAYCWARGSLYLGADAPGIIPLDPSVRWESTVSGEFYWCAVSSEGEIFCWGADPPGISRDRLATDCPFFRTTCARGLNRIETEIRFDPYNVVAADPGMCALDAQGTAYCWGQGVLGNGSSKATASLDPLPVSGNLSFRKLRGGYQFVCGLTDEGELYCWGQATNGNRGDGSSLNARSPVRMETDLRFIDVTVGRSHVCAVTLEFDAYCWGTNIGRQLGDRTTAFSRDPVRVRLFQ